MDWPTIIVGSIVAIIVLSVIIRGVINIKKGKHSCSCGGSCGSCGMSHMCHPKE